MKSLDIEFHFPTIMSFIWLFKIPIKDSAEKFSESSADLILLHCYFLQNLSPDFATVESQSRHFSCSATVLQNSAASGQFQCCRIVAERLQNNSAGFTAETRDTCRICRINSANFIVLRNYVT